MLRTLVSFVVVSAFVLSPSVVQREPLYQEEAPSMLAQSPWPCPPCPWKSAEATEKPKSKKVKKERKKDVEKEAKKDQCPAVA